MPALGALGSPVGTVGLFLIKSRSVLSVLFQSALDLGCGDGWLVLDVGDVLVICLCPIRLLLGCGYGWLVLDKGLFVRIRLMPNPPLH